MTSAKIPIAVVVPVKNEEANLPRCLPRLEDFAEVYVVDSGSTDRTRDIAREHGATLIDFTWNGRFPKKRNWFLENVAIASDWVLFLDADELVDERFCAAAADAVKSGSLSGYWLNYTNHFMGGPLRHGVPQRKLALFRKDAGRYERIEEDHWTSLDMEVHEHPQIDGATGEIAAAIDHDDDRGLARFIDRHRDYAVWEARRARLLAAADRSDDPRLTRRQNFKYGHIARFWYAPFYFIYTYVLRGGFLDGSRGFAYAVLKAWYFYLIRLLIIEQGRRG